MRRLVPIVLAGALLAACGGGGGNDGGDRAARDVAIELIAFKPERLAVKAGERVTWTQKDASVHTVTSGTVTQDGGTVRESPDGRFDSGQLAQNKTFTFTFGEAGTYRYFCRIHPATMRGEVQVS